MRICKYCNEEFENRSIGAHIKWCKLNPNREKYLEHAKSLNGLISAESRKKQGESLSKTCKDKASKGIKCGGWPTKGWHHTAESKIKISAATKKWMSENRDKLTWNVKKKKSAPCDKFKDLLRAMDVKFIDEYSPFTERQFAMDVAFPDRMVAVEINGNQHYNVDGALKPYYQERHDFIESKGWKLYEIHFSRVYADGMEAMVNQMLSGNEIKGEFDYDFWISQPRSKRERDRIKKLARQEEKKQKTEELIRLVMSSDIDFSKFGWVNKTARLLNKQPHKVSEWMKTYMLDFYEERCFKRKNSSFPFFTYI